MRPLACITCGPAYEKIDQVRRITNFSTGKIGAILAEAFSIAGCEVICFRSEASTFPAPRGVDVRSFSTNESLASGLQSLTREPAIVLHAAALCDFVLESVEGADPAHKLSSRAGSIRITLKPAEKVLPKIRGWFPEAKIIGWKYELDGSRKQAITRAEDQIRASNSDACVLNGTAYGAGFGLISSDFQIQHFPDKSTLATRLAHLFASTKL